MTPGMLQAIRALGAAVGLSGTLYVLGFLTEVGREAFLGVSTPGLVPLHYMLFGARFLSEVLQFGAEILYRYRHWIILGFVVGIGMAIVIARKRLRLRLGQFPQGAWLVIALLLVGLGFVKALILDLPIMRVDKVLLGPIRLETPRGDLGYGKPVAPLSLRKDLVCSRVGPTVEKTCQDPFLHLWQLRKRFGVVLLLGGAALALWRLADARSAAVGQRQWSIRLLFVALILVALLNFWSLPQVYSRTLHSTEMPIALVQYEEPNIDPVRGILESETENRLVLRLGSYALKDTEAAKLQNRKEIPRTQVQEMQWMVLPTGEKTAEVRLTPRSAKIEAYILGESESMITVLDRFTDEGQVLHIPRSKIASVRVLGTGDPLRHRLEPRLAQKGPG